MEFETESTSSSDDDQDLRYDPDPQKRVIRAAWRSKWTKRRRVKKVVDDDVYECPVPTKMYFDRKTFPVTKHDDDLDSLRRELMACAPVTPPHRREWQPEMRHVTTWPRFSPTHHRPPSPPPPPKKSFFACCRNYDDTGERFINDF